MKHQMNSEVKRSAVKKKIKKFYFFMFLLFSLNIFCKQIDLTVLYENSIPNILNSQYLNILNNKISALNTKLNTSFRFNIETLNSFEQFSKDPDYEELSFLAGSDSIEERFHNLNPSKNTLLLITSNLNETIFQKKDTSCFRHILMNRNSQLLENKDVIFQLEMGVVALVLKILNVDLKNVNEFLIESVFDILKDYKGAAKMKNKCLNDTGDSKSSDSESSDTKKEYSKLYLNKIEGFRAPHFLKDHKNSNERGFDRAGKTTFNPKYTDPGAYNKQTEDGFLRNKKFTPPKFSTDTNFSVGDGSFRRIGLARGRIKGLPLI